MATEFQLPELGENIESCDVVNILVAVGDTIEKEQPVIEIETEKASVEVPSSVSGVIKEIHVEAGDTLEVGGAILTVETEAEGKAAPEAEEADAAEKEEAPAEEEPSEAEEEAPEAEEKEAAEGEEEVTAVEQEQAVAAEQAPETEQEDGEAEEKAPAKTEETSREIAPAAPSVRRFAREIGVNIGEVSGSGPSGRISIEDVKAHARQFDAHAERAEPAEQITGQPLPDFSQWGDIEREPMSNLRRATATHLSRAWNTIPHVTNHDKADITQLEELRKRFASRTEEAGGKLTITAILLKVACAALKQFPQFNASVDMANEEIIYKRYYHVGVAVDTERGLLVPVIRDVDGKGIIELAVELGEVAEKARNRKLSREEMEGGTFTITNLGGIGGTHFSPIVNFPQVAILGVARSRIEPVYIDERFQPRLTLPLAVSYDHRLIDGADATRFLRWMVEALEQPILLAFEG